MKEQVRAFVILRWYLAVIIGAFALILIGMNIYQSISYNQYKEQLVREMTYNKTFRLRDLGVQERFNVYLDQCIRIWNTFGYTHRGMNTNFEKKAMGPQERKEIWKANFEFAEKMGFAFDGAGYYDVFVKGVMESDLSPYKVGPGGELTWLQLKPVAVDEAYGILRSYLPEQWKTMLDFSWNGDLSSLSSLDALKIAYVLMWRNKRLYKGQEIWYVSMYHWGDGNLGKHFRGGYGFIPAKFTIDNIDYDPLDYYIKYMTIKTAWDMGDLEAGKDVKMMWEQTRERMIAEERMLVESYEKYVELKDKVKEFESIIADRDSSIAAAEKKMIEVTKVVSNMSKHYQETFASVQTWREGNLKAYMRYRSKEALKILQDSGLILKDNPWKFYLGIATMALGILIYLVFSFYCMVKYLRHRAKIKKGQEQ